MALPFISGNRYVAMGADGRFHVYWGGQDIGNYGSQAEAEGAYNARSAQEEQAGSAPPPSAPGSASTAPVGTTSGVSSDAAQLALAAWVAAQQAKANADRLNLLDIPKWQKDAAIAEADLKLRQAAEARASLNDDQRRQLDAQAGALAQAKVFGYSPTLGQGTGAKLQQAANQLRSDPGYQAVAQRAGQGDAQAMAQKRQMEIGIIANTTGLTMEKAAALSGQFEQRRQAMGGALMGPEEIDRFLAQSPEFQTQTLEREQYGTNAALDYMKLRASMSGRPEDAFTYAATIRDTPDSIRNLINSAAARVNLPGLAYPGGQAGQMAMERAALPAGVGLSGPDPRADAAAGMTAANQINPQDYQRANPYLQKMVWAGYGANKLDPDAEKAKYYASLPSYSGASTGTVRR
jgi:hypothetical protein